MKNKAILLLSDGTFFEGISFGYKGERTGEIVFNTSLTGYEEIITDPSYAGQMVTFCYPHIGNYGISKSYGESFNVWIDGIIVRDYSDIYSNYTAKTSLSDYLNEYKVPGIHGIDTRKLVKIIRNKGSMSAIISSVDFDISSLKEKIKLMTPIEKRLLVNEVNNSNYAVYKNYKTNSPISANDPAVAVIDFGVKLNIIRCIEKHNFKVRLFPSETTLSDILKYNTTAVVLSNGPGDPAIVNSGVSLAKELLQYNATHKLPVLGICLGHQILSLASGAQTYKLKFGHHGGNHPVKNLVSGAVEITVQNHNYAVRLDSVPDDFTVTHLNLNDNTVEGISHKKYPIISYQYHPEAAPGPHDSEYIFNEFLRGVSYA